MPQQAAIQTEEMTDHQCETEPNEIDLLLDNETDIYFLPAGSCQLPVARRLE